MAQTEATFAPVLQEKITFSVGPHCDGVAAWAADDAESNAGASITLPF
jgi:hypothetical protein